DEEVPVRSIVTLEEQIRPATEPPRHTLSGESRDRLLGCPFEQRCPGHPLQQRAAELRRRHGCKRSHISPPGRAGPRCDEAGSPIGGPASCSDLGCLVLTPLPL